MNQSIESDDELIALLERTMREVARLAPDMRIAEARHNNRWMATAAAAAVVVAGAAGAALVAGNRSDPVPLSSGSPAMDSAPPGTGATSDTVGPDLPGTLPSATPATIPSVFPDDVPRPDTFDSMHIMKFDELSVGWEFLGRGQPTQSVERCTTYAATFDESWTSTVITNEAAAVLYARFFDNAEWRVGIYCTDTGDYLVQVMPSTSSMQATVGTVVATTDLAPPGTGATSDTVDPDLPGTLPSGTPATIPSVFPDDVPRPDTFDSMHIMKFDELSVGWEFLGRGQPTQSVERCTTYAATFDESWTSTVITNEAASVLYGRFFDNTEWRVGIYCTDTGDYLVQLMPATNA